MTRYSAGKASATPSLPNWNVGPKHAAVLSNLGYRKKSKPEGCAFYKAEGFSSDVNTRYKKKI